MISYQQVQHIRQSDLPGQARHILLELTIRSNKNSLSWPSHARIAEDTGYSKGTVKRMLILLEKNGFIAVGRKRGYTNNYIVLEHSDPIPLDHSDPTPDHTDPTPHVTVTPPQVTVTYVNIHETDEHPHKEKGATLDGMEGVSEEDETIQDIISIWRHRSHHTLEVEHIDEMTTELGTSLELIREVIINWYDMPQVMTPKKLFQRVRYLVERRRLA